MVDACKSNQIINHDYLKNKLSGLCQEIRERAALPLDRAVTLPAEIYTDQDFFQFEQQKILRSGWQCVAHVSQIPEAGSYLAIDLLDEPLLVVRQQDLSIKILSRICAHRATDIMHECFGKAQTGTLKRFSCPYHAWSYDLNGQLRAAAGMQDVKDFNKSDYQLSSYRSEVWEGFVFINMDGKAEPIAEQLKEMQSRISPWTSKEYEVAISLEWECEYNWKVLIENWVESYHHMAIHYDTLQPVAPTQTYWTEPEHPHFIHCHIPLSKLAKEQIINELNGGESVADFQVIAGLTEEQQTQWQLYLAYPNFMFVTMRDRTLWYRVLPIDANRCKLHTMVLVTKESKLAENYQEKINLEIEAVNAFHGQDMQVNTAVHKGLLSGRAIKGRLSILEEPIWLIQRYLAARTLDNFPQVSNFTVIQPDTV